jgi:hypothetical protein
VNASGTVLLEGNTASGAADDGYQLEGPATTVRRNLAVGNGDFGFEAGDVMDGGGNRAYANANPEQCVSITCDGKHAFLASISPSRIR